jgi:hypothetical protein
MNIEIRKLNFIQEFLRFPNESLLDKFEKLLRDERIKLYEKEIKPMTLSQYEQKIDKALDDCKNKRVKNAVQLKKDISLWK